MFSEHARLVVRRNPPGARSLAALVFALVLAACGGTQADETGAATPGGEGGLSIVATTTILGDITSEVAGDAAEVSVLMPAGADPHTFEPSAQQLAQMHEADLVVTVGANLEEHLQGPIAEVENAGIPVFHAIEHVETLTFGAGETEHAEEDAHEHASEDEHTDEHADDAEHADEHSHEAEHASEDEHADEHASEDEHAAEADDHADGAEHAEGDEHAHEEGSIDPHFWGDPTRTAQAVLALAEQIGELSGDPEAVQQRAEDYAQRLEQLDQQITETLAGIPDSRRTLVTNHEAFNYFADRYGFTIVGTVIPSLSTGAEPSARDRQRLAETIQEHHVTAIFAENTQPAQLAETLAQDVGTNVEVVELYSDSLGEEGSGAATYVDLMQTNANLVSEALGG